MANEQESPDLLDAKKGVKAKKPAGKSSDIHTVLEEGRNEAYILNERIVANKHAIDLEKTKQGLIGYLMGSGAEKSGNIAFVCIISCFALIAVLLYRIDLKNDADFFLKFLAVFIPIITASLGYLFGSGKIKK